MALSAIVGAASPAVAGTVAAGRAASVQPPSDPAHLAAQSAIAVLRRRAPRLQVQWQRDGRLPALLTGLAVPTQGLGADAQPDADALARARGFLLAHPALVGGAVDALAALPVSRSARRTVVRFEARPGDVPLLDRTLSVTLDAEGRVLHFVSDLPPLAAVPAGSVAADAATAAARAVPRLGRALLSTPTPALWQPAGRMLRVWRIDAVVVAGASHLRVLVDAATGEVVHLEEQVRP
ncbi:MAG: hypothetical protein RIT45_4300 [Pseudomonadota bacterium]